MKKVFQLFWQLFKLHAFELN